MQKRLRGLTLIALMMFAAYMAYADTVSISTYYPSPYGSYKYLEVQDTLTVGTLRGGSYGFGGVYVVGPSGCDTPNPFTTDCSCPDGFSSQMVNTGGSNLHICYR